MAKFGQGQPINRNGRPKGSQNKDTILRNYLIDLLYRKQDELEGMSAKELLKPIARLLPNKLDINVDHKSLIVNINKTIAPTNTQPIDIQADTAEDMET